MSPAEQEEFQQAFAGFQTRVDKADLREDRAAALLDPASRWNPLIDATAPIRTARD